MFYTIAKHDIAIKYNLYRKKLIITKSLDSSLSDEKNDDASNLYLFFECKESKKQFTDVEDNICIAEFTKKIRPILRAKEFQIFCRIAINEESVTDIAKDMGVTKQNISKVYITAREKVEKFVRKKGVREFF